MFTITWKQYQQQLENAEKTMLEWFEQEQKRLAAEGLEMVQIIRGEYEIRPIQKRD